MVMKRILLAMCTVFLSSAALAQTGPALLMRNPTVSRTHIVFSYAGDLWIVSREGGEATRLTTGTGNESGATFSPDGQTIVFTGEYDGNVDVYTISATGGVPKRLTFHPGSDGTAGWTPDGKRVLFSSGRDAESGRFGRLFTMAVDGTFPEALPLPMGFEGAYSPDGKRIAYVPIPRGFAAWKRYRGGMTTPIWIANLADSVIEKIPRENSNDFCPMWLGDRVYFLSDRNGPITLFAYDTGTKKVTEVLPNRGLDIKSASLGPDAIVYEQFGALNLFDLKSGKIRKINVTINADQLAVRPRYEKVGSRIRSTSISPTGARAIFEARGEILSVPAEKGDARNLTRTPGAAERFPSWSPDGKWIAYFSDEGGEYALHLRNQTGLGEVKKIQLGSPPSFYYQPTWSPDSKKIAYTDKRLNYWYVEIDKGTPVKFDTSPRGFVGMSWAPDSRWITYSKPTKSWYSAVMIYSLEGNKTTQVTDGMSDAQHPVFDRNGKYLYFTASTDIGPAVFGFDMSSYPHRPTRNVYVTVLRKDLPSPLAPESDEEKIAEDKPAEKKPEAPKEVPKVTIDFDRISQRILAMQIPARNYVALEAGKANTLFIIEPVPQGSGAPGAILHKYDVEKRKFDKVIEGITSFDLSENGEKMLYAQGPNWFIASVSQPIKPGEGKIKTEDMEVFVDPKLEWEQMYRETWRIERDFFYDPSYHGLDIKAMEKKYEPYVASLAHRADLNYLFQEMLGELSVGHLYVQGGDIPNPNRVPGGLLGADYTVENGRYRFKKVFDGENWNPQLRAPLTQPGVNVQAGEYLLAVNGKNLTSAENIYAFFQSTSGKQIVLRVGPNPDGSGSRDVTVVPMASESMLRNFAWVESNRRKVGEMTGGKVAYVYLPDTAGGGFTFFNRYYFSQLDRDGIVIDERFNSGGQAADYVIDYLRKPLMSYWAVRDGEDFRQPFGVMPGPKAMLVNEYSGSGGDYMPWMFRRSNLGPLIGKRTWGGLVGIGGYPNLIDGGSVTAPHFAFYSPEGRWEVENHGVAPDIEVDHDPAAWRKGRDPQLERAVQYVMDELKKKPKPQVKRPPYPNYHNGRTAMP